jgi:hypothetical protein
MMNYTLEQAAKLAEEALGNNLMRLTDLLDQRIRQGDKEVISVLAQLEHAHIALCKAGAHKLTCHTH